MGKVSCYFVDWSYCMDIDCVVVSMFVIYNIDRVDFWKNSEILLDIMVKFSSCDFFM